MDPAGYRDVDAEARLLATLPEGPWPVARVGRRPVQSRAQP